MFILYCHLNVHVKASNREVLRQAYKKLKKPLDNSEKMRRQRKIYYKRMLVMHKDAQKAYNFIYEGGW